ncbi:MAG: class F sortase [Microcella sp.]|nr:class F sortase [Microcella sp.]
MRVQRSGGLTALVVGLLLLAGCSAVPAEKRAGAPGIGVLAQKNSIAFESVSISIDDLVPTPVPLSISVAGIVTNMPVEPQGLDAQGQMALPKSPFVAGWYRFASAPGSGAGSTVIASHVDALGEGLGPFAQLRSVPVGTEVSILDSAGVTHTYRIIEIEKIDKDVVPWNDYFSNAGTPRLVLVTCGGEYDPGYAQGIGRYEDNYIVTAEKVS